MKTVEFQSTRSPAHCVRTTGAKFVGGTLIVLESEAPEIRAYAAKYPQFGIREIVAPAPPPPAAPVAAATPPARPTRPSRRATPAVPPVVDPEPIEPTESAPGPSYADGGIVAEATFAEVAAGEAFVPVAPPEPDPEVES